MEYEQSKFTRSETIDVISKYVGVEYETMFAIVALLEKLSVIPEYAFKEEQKPK